VRANGRAKAALVTLACVAALVTSSVVAAAKPAAKTPPPPKFPKDFVAKGRYIVEDLHADVPMTWEGHNGESQMIIGGEKYPIYFTNIIAGGRLYTLTYKWPGIARRPCSDVGPFAIDALNQFLTKARYVGPETLENTKPARHVHHWRVGVVAEAPPGLVPPELLTPVGGTPGDTGGLILRFPLMQGDFYTDQKDPTTFWRVLHFGLQNIYDPELDEWAFLNSFSHRAGTVTVPAECTAATTPPST
jgi:hypothetical protein